MGLPSSIGMWFTFVLKKIGVSGEMSFIQLWGRRLLGIFGPKSKRYWRHLKEVEKGARGLASWRRTSSPLSRAETRRRGNEIVHNKSVLTKLAVSHGIGQSLETGDLWRERSKDDRHTKNILSTYCKKERSRCLERTSPAKWRALFERTLYYAHAEMLHTPSFSGTTQRVNFYRRTSQYLDINKRVESDNGFDCPMTFWKFLSNEINHQQSSRPKLTIRADRDRSHSCASERSLPPYLIIHLVFTYV